MKKKALSLLIVAAYTSALTMATLTCSTSNKTFFMPRTPANLALEYSAGWRGLIYRDTIDKFGGNIQALYFSDETISEKGLGSYFSPFLDPCKNSNCFSFGLKRGTDQTISEALNLRDFIHIPTFPGGISPSPDERAASMNLLLKRKSSGVLINLHQDLDKIAKGLFIKANLPIVSIDHSIRCCINTNDIRAGAEDPVITSDQIKLSLAHYFSGSPVNTTFTDETTTGVLQKKLVKLNIPSAALPKSCRSNRAPEDESELGLADVDIQLGYHIIATERYQLAVGISATVPTGNEPTASRLWEPTVGNGGHSGAGFTLYGDARLWGNKHHNLILMGSLDYRYLFAACERRTLGLCGQPWGHYRLLGKIGEPLLIPAANILAQKVEITPGNKVDCIIQGIYNFYGFAFDLGCNIFYKDEESLHFLPDECVIPKNTYAFPSKEYNPLEQGRTKGFGVQENSADPSLRAADFADPAHPTFIHFDDIDKSPAKTPSLLSFKVYGGLSYGYKTWNVPLMVGIGAHYEHGALHKTPNSWGFAIKAAVAF